MFKQLYRGALASGSMALMGSIIVQLWAPMRLTLPADVNGQARHIWCVGELQSLRAELEEAVAQALAGPGPLGEMRPAASDDAIGKLGPLAAANLETTGANVETTSWSSRLLFVRKQCSDSQLAPLGGMLAELASHYGNVVALLRKTRQQTGAPLEAALRALQ